MMIKFLLLALFICNGHGYLLSSFERYNPFRAAAADEADDVSLDHKIHKIQSAVKVTEVALNDKDGCLRRAMCVMGTVAESDMPRMSIAAGADNSLHILERMIEAAGQAGMTKDDLPNIRQILASNAVGRSGGDLSLCESLFPECRVSVTDLFNEALEVAQQVAQSAINPPTAGIFASLLKPPKPADDDDTATKLTAARKQQRKGRVLCHGSGSLCPGIVIGCSLCGMFSPGVCDDTCIVAGLYCGGTGYACSMFGGQKKPSNDNHDDDGEHQDDANDGNDDDDEATTQFPDTGAEEAAEAESAAETQKPNKVPK